MKERVMRVIAEGGGQETSLRQSGGREPAFFYV